MGNDEERIRRMREEYLRQQQAKAKKQADQRAMDKLMKKRTKAMKAQQAHEAAVKKKKQAQKPQADDKWWKLW